MALGMPTLPAIPPLSPKPIWGSTWADGITWGSEAAISLSTFLHCQRLLRGQASSCKMQPQVALKEESDYFEMCFRAKMPDVLSGWLRSFFFLNIFSNSVVDDELFCSLPSLLAPKPLSVAHWSRNSSSPPFQLLHHVRERETRAVSSGFLHKRLRSCGGSAAAADSRRVPVGPEPHQSSTCFENPSSCSCPC